MSARPMSEQFAALVKLAGEIETRINAGTEATHTDAARLTQLVLNFADDHGMVERDAHEERIEALVPFESPLRNEDRWEPRPEAVAQCYMRVASVRRGEVGMRFEVRVDLLGVQDRYSDGRVRSVWVWMPGAGKLGVDPACLSTGGEFSEPIDCNELFPVGGES